MEHKNVSLADRVFERLESDLLGGRYQRGELLTEHRLVEDLGVSRTPIREALRRLEQEHIIEIGGRGILVIGVSEEDVKDIFDIRLRMSITTSRKRGIINPTISASRHWIVPITTSAPKMVTPDVSRSSGPWWASSVTSNRSDVSRLISCPVRLRS